jgi:hypothetical protein
MKEDRRNWNCGGVCIHITNNITSEVILPADFPTESPVDILVLKTDFHGYMYFHSMHGRAMQYYGRLHFPISSPLSQPGKKFRPV